MDNHKKMEQEIAGLKSRVSELSDFIENASVPLHQVNSEGIIIWANQEELNLLGYSEEEYIGSSIQDYHVDADVIQEIIRRLLSNETLRDFPARLRCKDGSIKNVTISSNALFIDGKFIHSRCFTKDITQIVRDEARKNKLLLLLEESEERLRLAIAATNLGTWDWDHEDGKIFFSNKTKEILNLQKDRFNYHSVLELIYPDDRAELIHTIQNIQDSKTDRHFDFVCRILKPETKDAMAWVRVQGASYFSHDERPRRIIGSILDITELKKSEAKNAELSAIVNSSNDAIVGKTLESIITSWNYAAEELFGYTADEMIGQSILKLIPEDRKHEEDFILERLREGESLKHFETKRITKSKKLLDLSLTISPIKNDDEEIIGVSKIARDITENKQEERRKNDFISIVSHELKTPLSSILLFTQVLQRKYSTKPDELDYQMSSKIENQAKKMTYMIRDFLSLARIEEGKLQMRKENFQIIDLFHETKHEAELISDNHEIVIECHSPVTIFADRDKIGQVFTNLVSNAIKYSPSGGTVRIGCEELDGKVMTYVNDEGVGISKADQKKLFQRFYRVDNEEIANVSGFGIGLYIVAEILRCHNSEIEVESEIGIGTTFKFMLETKNIENSNQIRFD